MALQYQTVSIKDFGAGIDQQSSENQLAEGFCEELLNCDPKPEGYLAKRPGYEGYAGDLPLRVKEMSYENNLLCFTFDSDINLSQIRSSPLVVYGQSSLTGGDFDKSVLTTQYYAGFSLISSKTTIAAGTTDTVAIVPAQQASLVWFSESTSFINNSNQLVVPDSNVISNSPIATGTITNNSGGDVDIFAYSAAADASPSLATVAISKSVTGVASNSFSVATGDEKYYEIGNTVTHTDDAATYVVTDTATGIVYVNSTVTGAAAGNLVNNSLYSISVIQGVDHSLDDFSILPQIYEVSGSDYVEVQPQSMFINQVTRDIEILMAASGTYRIHLKQLPIENVATGTVGANSSNSVSITGLTGDFAYFVIFLDDGSNELEVVQPDNITVDAVNNTALVTFTNNSPVGANFSIYYDYADVQVNKICVTPNLPPLSDQVTTDISLTVWGIKQEEAYIGASGSRAGWVTHIDSYRSPAGAYLVAGLGGNLFREAQRTEVYNFISTYGAAFRIPSLYPDLRARLANQINTGPAFYPSTDEPVRTRGFITADNLVGASNAQVESIIWQSGTTVRYTLNVRNHSITGSPIETTAGFEDELIVEDTNYSQFNGTFKISAWGVIDADNIYIDVTNTAVTDGDFDVISDAAGNARIETDNMPLVLNSEFLVGDELQSDFFDGTQVLSVVATNSVGTTVKVTGFTKPNNFPAGLRLTGKRTSSILPLRNAASTNNDTVEDFVRGDMVQYTDYERQFEVLSVNPLSDTAVTITVSDGVATVSGASTDALAVGQKVLFVRAGVHSGTQTVTAITDTAEFTFDTDETANAPAGATLKGKTIEIDEEIEFQDAVENTKTVEVPRRWVPIELPVSTEVGTLTPLRQTTYFGSNPYTDQNFLRSSMVSNNMYFTDGDDVVMKYDGTNLYRAGLFRWQPHLFVATDSAPSDGSGTITFEGTSAVLKTSSELSRFKLESGAETRFSVGDTVKHTDDGAEYIVTGISEDNADGHVAVNNPITGVQNNSFSILKRQLFRYYFRLNAVDANDNLLASAVTGADDFVVELYESAQVKIRLIGMPIWDIYDYDRLEVEIYRTKANDAANYYHIATIPMSFNDQYGYIDFKDTDSDNVLSDFDSINVALKGAELGTQFSEPLRAKYLTSAGNRLILANLKDYPELDIRLFDTGPRIDVAALDGLQWQLRRDATSTVTGTDTNIEEKLQLEFTDASTPVTLTLNAGSNITMNNSYTGWIYLFHADSTDQDNVELCGWWYASSGVISWGDTPASVVGNHPSHYATASSPDIVPVYLGEDGNYSTFNGNTDVTSSYQQVAVRRLANAINFCMRYSTDPWITAGAGNEFQAGQLVLRAPKVLTTNPEVVLPNFSGFNIFVNGIKRAASAEVSAQTVVYPSRLVASAQNYAEIFDNPRAVLDSDSFSAVDVNSADGQEITGVIPFFGDSAFGSAQKDSVIVVFKENSIYLVNLAAKAQGLNAVQKVESQGLGCTAPYSIASTRDGIMFANESGMFRLTRDLRIEYIGQKLERIWQQGDVNLDALSIAQGTHYAIGRQYKLSVPVASATVNSDVMVYNHTREYRGKGFGSWTRYDNHAATGWANLKTNAFFGAANGMVFRLRNEGTETDYRDRAGAYTMSAIMRAMDFGDSGRRKALSKVAIQFRVADDQSATVLSSAPDLGKDFSTMDSFKIEKAGVSDSLSDELATKVKTITYSPNRRKFVYFQVKLENTALDEIVEVAGIDFRVAGLSDEGMTEAKQTQD